VIILHTVSRSDDLISVLQGCDMAITRAVESGEDSSPETNDLFEQTTRKLHDYHKGRKFK
jgi:hypothetical protein